MLGAPTCHASPALGAVSTLTCNHGCYITLLLFMHNGCKMAAKCGNLKNFILHQQSDS